MAIHRHPRLHLTWSTVLLLATIRRSNLARVARHAALLAVVSLVHCLSAQETSPAQLHERRAQVYLAKKQPKLAIPEFQAVLAADPNNLDAQANLGVLLYFQHDYATAAPYLRQAVTQKPDLTKIRALLGLAEKALNQPAAARTDLEAAVPQLSEPPIRIQAGLALIELEVAAQDLDKAAITAAQLREVAPTDPQVLYATYRIATDQAGEAMLSLSIAAPNSAQMHQAMAHELERARDIPAAITNLRKAVEIDPALPGIHYELAEALHESDDPKVRAEAEPQYKLAIEQDPRDARSAAALGDLAADHSDFATAATFYQQALAIDPHQPDSAIGLARIRSQQGDVAGAAQMLEQVVAVDPTNTLAHYRLSGAYRKLGRIADAKREVDDYQRYKEIKERMRTIYKNMRQESPEDASPAKAQD
jgi:tetratricopeptide (TPR) repeat protein